MRIRSHRSTQCHYTTLLRFLILNDTATTEIYTLSLHDALPISAQPTRWGFRACPTSPLPSSRSERTSTPDSRRSEEHTSELQSRQSLVCRLLFEKKKRSHFSTPVTSISRMPSSS